jgi:choline dehydrogenase-like flavoprotein
MEAGPVELLTHCSVKRVITSGNNAVGVQVSGPGIRREKFFAGKIILSAGGLGTPVILQNSGIEAGDNLFVDLFNITYGISPDKEFNQSKELTMSVVSDKFYNEGFVFAPFIDNLVSFPTSVSPRHFLKTFRLGRLLGIMAKINDDNVGRVNEDGTIDKEPTDNDLKKLKRGSDVSAQILKNCGVNPKTIFAANPRGAHPGGTAAIGKVVGNDLQTKLKNLYVCDCSVLPFAPGLPPMLYLIAMTKWFGKKILN